MQSMDLLRLMWMDYLFTTIQIVEKIPAIICRQVAHFWSQYKGTTAVEYTNVMYIVSTSLNAHKIER